jgi:uracil-DNA glycosylase
MSNRRQVEESIASCTACHLATPQVAPVPFRGPTPAVAAVVAEAPGQVENREGRPLIGPAGQLLDDTLKRAGADLGSLAYFNVVSCYPLVASANKPTPQSITACRSNFEAQLELIDPKILLLLGNYALQAFFPDKKIMASRGQWLEHNGRRCLPCLHPAAILRNREWADMFRDDIVEFVGELAILQKGI